MMLQIAMSPAHIFDPKKPDPEILDSSMARCFGKSSLTHLSHASGESGFAWRYLAATNCSKMSLCSSSIISEIAQSLPTPSKPAILAQ